MARVLHRLLHASNSSGGAPAPALALAPVPSPAPVPAGRRARWFQCKPEGDVPVRPGGPREAK